MDLTTLFCDVDDFVKKNKTNSPSQLEEKSNKYSRPSALSESEIMTICIAFHQSGYRNLKAFYREYVFKHLYKYFPKLVSYIPISAF